MSEHDQRPPVGVAHVVLETDRMEEFARFMRTIGMRAPCLTGRRSPYSNFEGWTHLILMIKDKTVVGDAGLISW